MTYISMDIENAPETVSYVTEYDPETKVYTGYCPLMKPVIFSSKDPDEVNALVKDGINLYLRKYPDFFKNKTITKV